MTKAKRIKHAVNIGDLIATMASFKAFYERTGFKTIICQQLNVPGAYPIGSHHPSIDEKGVPVTMNQKHWEMIKPLLLSQEYIEGVEIFEGQEVNIDMDVIRKKIFVNLGYMALQQWPILAFPDMATDLTKPWLILPDGDDTIKDKIVCNFTDRYRNDIIHYFFLKNYESHLVFAGTESEHSAFCTQWKLDIPRLYVDNFLDLATALRGAMFTLCNQSFIWNLCEAQKLPRLLEMSPQAPNCQPFIGEDSYGFFHQTAVEYYFELLFKKYTNNEETNPVR